MNALQSALDTLAGNASWKDAIMYSLLALLAFSVLSALLRSGFMLMMGAVVAFYLVVLQSPDSKFSADAAASQQLVEQLVMKSQCAAIRVGQIENLGKIVLNGDVLEIAESCGLMP
ncbi:hypothetical protein ACI0X9_003304 [Cronobacter turicensis]